MLKAIGVLAALVLVAWLLTSPQPLAESALPQHTADPVAGERWYWAGGCASCHMTSADGKRVPDGDKLSLGGGLELDTPYGVFRVPNISPHPSGIGGWTTVDFVNAMQRGVSPSGRHYYPSFPYASYARMDTRDVMDLKAFLDGLAPVNAAVEDHELGFPWSLRRGLGAWKRLYLDADPVTELDASEPALERGRYLVESAGHCGECHTPRDGLGGMRTDQWLAGAPNLDGAGSIPNITPGSDSIGSWSVGDIAYYLESGFTPDWDTVGGSMVAVQENFARLSDEDRKAVAAYLKAIRPLTSE
jgi:mono/diheme cytochrome c family protein